MTLMEIFVGGLLATELWHAQHRYKQDTEASKRGRRTLLLSEATTAAYLEIESAAREKDRAYTQGYTAGIKHQIDHLENLYPGQKQEDKAEVSG